MKRKSLFIITTISLLLCSLAIVALAQEDSPVTQPTDTEGTAPSAILANVSNAFTYQGYLEQNGVPVDGTCDFEVRLFDAPLIGGIELGFDEELDQVVTDGRFTLILNKQGEYGANAFNGEGRWLHINVRCPAGSGNYTALTPRQPLTASPYAHSLRPGATIDGTTNPNVGILNLVGTQDALRIINAGDDGVEIENAGNDGVLITHAGDEGVQVLDANGAGVWAATSNNADYGGYFVNNGETTAEGVGLYARGNQNSAPDLVLGSHNGVIRSDPAFSGGDLFITSSDAVIVRLDDDGTSVATNDQADFIVEVFDHNTGTAEHLLRVANTGFTTVQILEITGGADLSEQFDVRSGRHDAQPEPGMVVCIDTTNPGKLIVCENANDRTVAGVISGAGGIQPGMLMGQDGSVADGQYPVALTGRVYVWADASSGSIQPGDLLTTSDILGFATGVVDYPRAQGAILGKAMTGLDKGQGLILVLITLQ